MADDKNKYGKLDKNNKVSADNDQLGENVDETIYSTTTTDKAKDLKTKGDTTKG